MKRRDLLKKAVVTSVAVAVSGRVLATDTDSTEAEVEFLFVQNAAGVLLKDGVLRMKGVAADTLYFSDRPERITGRISTQEFVDFWAAGDDSFAEDPPNAVLSVFHEPEPQDVVLILRNPRLEGADLVYDIEVLDGVTTASGAASALFIDNVGNPMSPGSVAGVNRRHHRRRRRVIRRNN